MAEAYLARSIGFQRSLEQLRRHVPKGELYEYLKDFASFDRVYQKWDFNELATLANYPFTVANSGGTSAADFAIVEGLANGAIRGDTGTTDNGSVSIIGRLSFYGNDNLGMLLRWRCDAITGANLEWGLIDGTPAANASGVSDVDTPATAASDCALFTFDTDQTATGLHFVTNGSSAGQDAVKTSVPVPALAVDTWFTSVIQCIGDKVYACYGSNTSTLQLVASHDQDADGAMEGGTAVAPWFYARTRNGTAKFPRIDLIEVWHDRQ